MLTLINGDGNPRVTAAQDADWYGSLTGEKTCIMPANDKFSATVADANTIEISSGVLITKEGRRVQIDAETIEEIIIPTGTQGSDTYYIIGFHLYIDESGQQVAETFVETMENESDTITETTFREGSTSIYISLYRVKRSGLTLESVTRICPMYEISADEIVYGNTDVGAELTQINSDLADKISNDLANQVVGETGVVKNFHVFKAGNNVIMSGKITISGGGTFGNNAKLLTVPEALRPSVDRNCNLVFFGDMNSGTFGDLTIYTNGEVRAHFDNSALNISIARFSISWNL